MDYIAITTDKINVGKALATLSHPSCGGTSCFIGTTRDDFCGKKVVELEYEAYESMAIKQIEKIVSIMKSKWSLLNVVVIHRLGCVPVCEASILVAASSVHRKEAMDAVAYGVDAVKAEVPIWKKEKYADGTYNWKENCESKNLINTSNERTAS